MEFLFAGYAFLAVYINDLALTLLLLSKPKLTIRPGVE